MKTLNEIKSILSEHKPDLCKRYYIKNLGIFGSYVRGSANEKSDLDILVHLEKPIGLDFVVLAEELENLLQLKVDLVSINAIKPNLFKFVEENLIYV